MSAGGRSAASRLTAAMCFAWHLSSLREKKLFQPGIVGWLPLECMTSGENQSSERQHVLLDLGLPSVSLTALKTDMLQTRFSATILPDGQDDQPHLLSAVSPVKISGN